MFLSVRDSLFMYFLGVTPARRAGVATVQAIGPAPSLTEGLGPSRRAAAGLSHR